MGEKKLHYKMYKDGKKFVFAAIATLSFFVFGGVSTVEVHADTTSGNVTAATVNSTSDTKSAAQSAVTAASSATRTDSTSASSSSAAKAETTGASSSSASSQKTSSVKSQAQAQPLTATTTGKAVRATSTSVKKNSAQTKVSYSTLLQQLRTSKALASDKAALTHVDKDNFLEYFRPNGSATYDAKTGIVTITPDQNNQVGNFSLTSKIDMNNSFTLTGQVNLGSNPNGADGIGFAFHSGNTTDVGIAGGNLGIGGLQDAIGFKLDTFSNNYQVPLSNKNGSEISSTDPDGFGCSGDPVKAPYGTFVKTSNQEISTSNHSKVWRWWVQNTGKSQALSKADIDGHFHDFVVNYDGATRKLTVSYTQASGKPLTWTTTVASSYQAMAMIVSASTGAYKNLQQFKLTSFDFHEAATVNVTYVDTTGHQLTQGTVNYPDGAYVNGRYTTEQLVIPNYTFIKMGDKSLDANGTLTHAGDNGTVIYVYAPAYTVTTESKKVNETVHYQGAGKQTPADHTAQVTFTRQESTDAVTGKKTYGPWTPKAEQTFDKVVSPAVAGYAPDIDQINAQTVKPTDNDLEFTVTYSPNVQLAHVKYIDDTDHKVLTQDNLSGRTGETSVYHTADRIAEFKGQHYDFVSDNYPADGITFDNNDRADQNYEVHFKHATRTDEQDVQVPRTIKYVYQNGQQAQPDHSDALKFHETKVVDLVDGHTVSDDWTPAQDFKTIETPAIQGYTPDRTEVANAGIKHDHSVIAETVTYNPDAQKAAVKYIDDTTGEQLEAKDLTGVSDQSTGYSTKDTIDGYINQHYVLVSDDTDGKTVVFDHDDRQNQSYEVHLKHGTESANESRIKKITVHYQYADGLARSGKAADDQTAANLIFKRTGTHDLVTDKTAWNAWDHSAQTFAEIDSPAIDGYTPDQAKVNNVSVTADSPEMTEKTVVYHADAQKLSVDFIDDTTGKTLKTVNKVGHSDESAGYSTKSDLQSYLAKHYDLVSDQTNGENLVFDHDDKADQHYEVHLTHHLTPINEQHTITETIHYQYADGLARSGKAADDFHADALKFSRTGNHDNVTDSDHWNAWTPADQQIFDRVQSPVIEGYTPDQAQIDAVTITPDSQNIEKTVTYTADGQKLTVNFIDDTTGKTLKTITKTGRSDESAGYSTKSDLQSYLAKHYDLVSDATNGADLVFDHNDGADQVYDVHLNHHLTPISDHQVVNETIHYVYADGLARTGKAADDYIAAPLEFSRTGKHDAVTDRDHWNAWTPADHQTFAAVHSPAIEGYTPDQAQIDSASVDPDSQDIVKTVTYSADQQKLTVEFIDDTDHGKVLKTIAKIGGSDEAAGYSTKADIQTFVDGHYKLDHDTSNGADLVFDHDDAVDQHYEVHLTHETTPISEATSTNRVIHYQLADGTPVAKDYTAKVDFSRDGFKDLVTNADHWNAWTPNATQTFDVVVSPVKAGYTVDHAQVDAVTVEPHHADLETTVTYSPDAQKAAVKYVDDTTGKTLQTKELTGVSDETSAYTTESTINQYVGQHYKLVSDQTNGKPVVFDHDDGSDQVFEVHLAHTYQKVSQEHQVHQTIHYQYADGKQARPDYTAAVLAFSRTGIQDLVTENVQWNAWTPDQTFTAVDTPAVNGYTPDIQTVAAVKVGHDSKDIEQTVVYHADDQTILVNYIDDDTQSTLKTDSIIGKTAQTSDYTTKKSLDQYKGQHYDVVSDDTNGNTLKFDSDSTKVQTYNVHLKHQHQAASDKSAVHQVVHYIYQDGKQAAKDHTAAPIEFTRTGDTDLVTGKTTWNAWTPATGTFVAVLSPAIAGYTPSRAMINHVDVHPGDKDLDTTVTYVPDQQVIVVNYIDQTTGKTLKTDTLNGRSDQTSGYATKSQIDSYLGQHYKLISDDTNGQTLTFDHDDQATQTYDVVLGHQTAAARRTHEVHETVDYVYADGSQAAKSFSAQPIVFSQTGVHDLVTNTTDWNGEWTKPQVFVAVESPKIVGFTASKPEVKAVEVNYQSSDVHELVIYAANAQTAQIKYIDDVTGNTLETDGASGRFNESIVFSHNVNDQINKFKQAHYKLVSNNFDGQKYQADNTKNVYEVHLIHERQNVHSTDSVTETVKFQYADGSQAQPVKTQTVNFGRDGIKDLVTGTTAWMPVDPQTIGAVDVPVIDGYTADIDQVPTVKVNFGDDDITKVVTYIANDQNAGIKIIDDTTGKVLNMQVANGKFGTEIQFKQDPDQQVIDLQAQHYELVSDNFKHQKYQADNAKNQFEIHVKHQMMDVQRTDKVTETVRYQDNHGNMLHPVTTQTKMFTEHGITDQVTGKTVWTPAKSQTMDVVSAPEITGYTPNKQSVPATTVNFGDKDINEVIVYTPVSETANIKYIDDTTGKTLSSQDLSGDYGTTDSYRTADSIKGYESQGYQLVSDNYPTNGVVYNQDGSVQSFEVHLTHGTTPVGPNNPQTPGEPINPDNPDGPKWPEGTDKSSLTQTVIRTVNYLDKQTGKVVAKQVTEQVTYNRTAIVDKVTGQIIGYSTTGAGTVDQTDGDKAWTAVDNKSDWDSVTSPDLSSKGYLAPDLATVAQQTVTPGDKDVTVNVYYDHDVVPVNPTNPQTPGTPINPDDPDSPKWPAGTDKNSLTTDVHQTIHYQYGDGSKAAPDKTDSTTFDHKVEIDKVTGKIVKDDGWTAENGKTSFDSKNSPVIPGYTASKPASDSVDGLTHDSKDNVQTIIYTSNQESAKVTYIDDTTGKTLSAKHLTGDYGSTDPYRTGDTIADYEKQGYQLVSDNYPTNGVVYNQDGTVQSFEVHLTHGTTPVGPNNPQTPGEPINPDNPDGPKWPEGTDKSSLTQTVIRTVNYLDKQTGKVVAKQVTEQVTYNRTAIVDKVTGQIIGYSTTGAGTVDQTDGDKAWTAVDNKSDWDSVTSPDLSSKGYLAPDLATVAQQTVTPGDKDVTVNVYYVYTKNPATDNNGGTGPNQPGKPGNSTDTGNPSSNQPGNPSQPSNATNNGVINTSTNTGSKVNNGAVNSPELPQTGENNSQSQTMSFIGILLAMFGSSLGFLGIKKRRND